MKGGVDLKKHLSLINNDVLKKLLVLSKIIDEKQEKYKEVLSADFPAFNEISENIDDIILDYIGVPPDTSLCYLGDSFHVRQYDTNNEECQRCTGCFCRDWFSNILFDYKNNELSLEETIDMLSNWNADE